MTESIAPSSLWRGTPVPGSRWTLEQIEVMRGEGVADPDHVATATISRPGKVSSNAWAALPQPILIPVPRLALTRDKRRAKIITPAGAIQWLDVAHG